MQKKAIKVICFTIIFIFLFYHISKVLWIRRNTISYFYEEPRETLDITFIGQSTAYIHFNTTLAFNLYGFTTGLLSDGAQPPSAIKYLIEESRKYQDSKLYVIDISRATRDIDEYIDGDMRKVTDNMKFSQNRINTINGMLSYRDVKKKDYINYYYSFLLYHGNWKNIDKEKIKGRTELYKGYLFNKGTAEIYPQEKMEWTKNEYLDLPEKNEEVLNDLLDYINEKQLNVLFVVAPVNVGEIEEKRLNTLIKLIQEKGYKVLNFATLDDYNVNFENDYYQDVHMNVNGATKYTLYLSKYIKENYDLPDHSNDPLYSSWNEEYKRFKEDYKSITGKDFEDLIDK